MALQDSETIANQVASYLAQLRLPLPNSHKGQNGKLLIIGGSELFHAASKWSLDVASKFVDMVFYASVPSNAELVRQAKGEFWNGIVIDLSQIDDYIAEADCVLVGPGMTRTPDVAELTNRLLATYPTKKWVIDAGALQMINPSLLNQNCIITPHYQELLLVYENARKQQIQTDYYFTDFMPTVTELDDGMLEINLDCARNISRILNGATVVMKGHLDIAADANQAIPIAGGNAGMTKGGTGDVLAGLVAALYATNDAMTAAVVASYANKKAGELLYTNVGPFFNASDLVGAVPQVLWELLSRSGSIFDSK